MEEKIMNVRQFMVTVETKNYPILSIRPAIQRYAKIRKKLNASEIANCLSSYAAVTLEKYNGSKVKLTANNFKDILYKYTLELKDIENKKAEQTEIKKNSARLNTMINTPAPEAAPAEEPESTVAPLSVGLTQAAATELEDVEEVDEPVDAEELEDVIENTEDENTEEQTEEYNQVDPENGGEFDDSAYYED